MIQDKINYLWHIYGITVSYDLDSCHYTKSGAIDHRYIRYKIVYPRLTDYGINFIGDLEADSNVSGCDISRYVERYFKRNPGVKDMLRAEMFKLNNKED